MTTGRGKPALLPPGAFGATQARPGVRQPEPPDPPPPPRYEPGILGGLARLAALHAAATVVFVLLATLAAGFSREFLPDVVRPEMLEQIRWHKEQQHTVVIVSGSLDLYLRPWCEQLGLQLICNRLESQDGRLTGRYAGGDCGPRKVEHIRRQFDLSRYVRIHAYGDSSEDKPMLALAHERWFRGKPLK